MRGLRFPSISVSLIHIFIHLLSHQILIENYYPYIEDTTEGENVHPCKLTDLRASLKALELILSIVGFSC